MKILHLNYTFGVVGGTESYLSKLIGDLRTRGHESEVAAEEDLTDGSIAPFHALDKVASYSGRWAWRQGRRFKEIIRNVDPDLIHIHNTLNADLVWLATEHRPALRFVHDHTVFCPGLNKVYADGGLCDQAMGRYCLVKYETGGCYCFRHQTSEVAFRFLKKTERLFDVHRRLRKIMVASHYMKDELVQAGMPDARIVVNPYYTEQPTPAEVPEEDPPLILTLCRMAHPDKGVIPLLNVLAEIDVPFRARLVGEGQHLDMMVAHAKKLGLSERVEFLGFVPHEKALDLLWRARVIAFPSMWKEPFGIVGIEAMARGKPVVAFDVGGVREWLSDGVTGLVVKRGDEEAFRNALTALLRDPERARALGAAGRARIRDRFVKARHLDVLEEVYREVAAASR